MGCKAFTPKQLIFNLPGVEVLVGQCESISIAYRKIAVTGKRIIDDAKTKTSVSIIPFSEITGKSHPAASNS